MTTPEEFVRKLNTEWSRGTMIESHGTHFMGRAVAQLDFKPALTQLAGLFHAPIGGP